MPKKLPGVPSLYPLITVEIVIGTVIAALAFYIFADMSRDVFSSEMLAMDHTLSQKVYALRTPFLTQLMLFITFLGGGIMLTISALGLFSYFIYKRYKREAVLFITTFGVGVLLNLLLKYIIGRARPDMAPLINEVFHSYPSGHSMNAFVFYALLAYFVFHFSKNMLLGSIVSALLIVVIIGIGISRIYLGVHYPSDVLAGFLAGAGWFLTVLVVDKTFQAYNYYREQKKTR